MTVSAAQATLPLICCNLLQSGHNDVDAKPAGGEFAIASPTLHTGLTGIARNRGGHVGAVIGRSNETNSLSSKSICFMLL